MAPESRSIPLKEYVSKRRGVLSEIQIAEYIEAMSADKAVVKSLTITTDRAACKLLTIQEYREHAHVLSGHALNFLRRNKLPDLGLQDLQEAQRACAEFCA
jgi:hypothetical protein